MASSDAKPIPQKNVAYRVTFPILDADGDLVTGAAALDSEVSKDGGTFADCTNEATEIATSSGMYYLDLTSAEMNADTVAVIVKTSTTGAKTTPIVMYPEEAGDIRVNATQWNSLTTVALPLVPTTAGRTLDVSAGGEAGLDWANIGSPTTAQNLSATNIDVDQVVASVTGAVGSVTGAVGSVTGAVGSVTGNVGGNVVGSVGSVNALAANVITAAATAADFTTEIQAGLATAANLATVAGYIDTEIADIQARLPAALVGGRIDASVGAMAANVLTAAATAADFGAEVADAVWDEATAGHTTAGSTGKALIDASAAGNPWSSLTASNTDAGSFGLALGTTLQATEAAIKAKTDNLPAAPAAVGDIPSAASIATAVTTTAMTESYRADGATGTLAQMQYEIIAHLGESAIVATTKTIKKVDGTTTAATFTLDDASLPTSITRST